MSSIKSTTVSPAELAPDVAEQLLADASQMAEIRELGICSTCDHAPSCLFLKASRKPVWYCDEFSDNESQAAANRRPVVQLAPADELNYREAQEVGLCANCETRKGCMHRQPGEPVWECEDYS